MATNRETDRSGRDLTDIAAVIDEALTRHGRQERVNGEDGIVLEREGVLRALDEIRAFVQRADPPSMRATRRRVRRSRK